MRRANSAYLSGAIAARREADAMSINDLPVLSALRTKMQWHQERQRVLSEHVANSDTPNFKPRDLVEPKLDRTGGVAGSVGALAMMRTSGSHIGTSAGGPTFSQDGNRGFQNKAPGHAGNIEKHNL